MLKNCDLDIIVFSKKLILVLLISLLFSGVVKKNIKLKKNIELLVHIFKRAVDFQSKKLSKELKTPEIIWPNRKTIFSKFRHLVTLYNSFHILVWKINPMGIQKRGKICWHKLIMSRRIFYKEIVYIYFWPKKMVNIRFCTLHDAHWRCMWMIHRFCLLIWLKLRSLINWGWIVNFS